MGVVSSRSFGREEPQMPEYPSKERVEREGVLLYIPGDPIDPADTVTLTEQGYLEAPKAKPKTANKARKATKNK